MYTLNQIIHVQTSTANEMSVMVVGGKTNTLLYM